VVRRRLSITEKLAAILQPLRQRKLFIGRSLQRAHDIDNDNALGCRAYGRPRGLSFHLLKDTGRERLQYIGSLDFRNYLEAVKMVCRWAKTGDIKPMTTLAAAWRPMAAAYSPFLIIQRGYTPRSDGER
jgi:hypothetical protein